MNQTAQQAAEQYVKDCDPAEILSLEEGKIVTDAFVSGWKEGQPQWIPVTERLPEDNGRYFCITADDTWIIGEYEHNYLFCDASGYTWRCKFWCPIPDSLLNFKP